MSLAPLAQALHGDVYAGGRRANIPFPGHSRRDRSVSLYLDDDARVVIKTFGNDGDWKAAADELIRLGYLDRSHRLTGSGGVTPLGPEGRPAISSAARIGVARDLWAGGRAVGGTPAEIHARLRGVTRDLPGPAVLRFRQDTPLSAYAPSRATRRGLLAAIVDPAGELTAVEITYLKANGRRDDKLRLPRKQVGMVPPGSACRLDEAGATLLVGEGIFTCLSASQIFGLPAWALLSVNNMRSWRPPANVGKLVIAGDRGAPGEMAAEAIARTATESGVEAEIAYPPNEEDWNAELTRPIKRCGDI